MGQIFPGSAHDPAPRRSSHWGNPGESLTQRFNRVMIWMVGFMFFYQLWKTNVMLPITDIGAAQGCRASLRRWLLCSHPDMAERLSFQKKSRVAEKSDTAAKTYATSSPPRWMLVSHLPQSSCKVPRWLLHLSKDWGTLSSLRVHQLRACWLAAPPLRQEQVTFSTFFSHQYPYREEERKKKKEEQRPQQTNM